MKTLTITTKLQYRCSSRPPCWSLPVGHSWASVVIWPAIGSGIASIFLSVSTRKTLLSIVVSEPIRVDSTRPVEKLSDLRPAYSLIGNHTWVYVCRAWSCWLLNGNHLRSGPKHRKTFTSLLRRKGPHPGSRSDTLSRWEKDYRIATKKSNTKSIQRG